MLAYVLVLAAERLRHSPRHLHTRVSIPWSQC